MDPINYSGMLTQIDLSPLQRGLQLRNNNRLQEAEVQQRNEVRQLAQRQFDMKTADAQAYQAAVEGYKANPTPEALRDLGIRFPEHQKQLQDAGDSYTASQKQDLIGAAVSSLGALAANKPDLAVKTLTDRVTALKNSGVDTSHTQAAIDMIKSGDLKGATAYLSYATAGLVGADHTAGIMDSFGIGAKADDKRADNERQAAAAAETARHNRISEGQGAARVQLSREAGARAASKGAAAVKAAKPPAGFILD